MAEDPGGKLGHFQEPGIVRTKTGRIVAAIRNQGQDNAIWTTCSDDDGKTWTPVKQSPMIGHPADLIQLADGRLLCTYGQSRGATATRGHSRHIQRGQRRDLAGREGSDDPAGFSEHGHRVSGVDATLRRAAS